MLRSHGDISVAHPWGGTAGSPGTADPGVPKMPRQRAQSIDLHRGPSASEAAALQVDQQVDTSVAAIAPPVVPDLVATAASAAGAFAERGAFAEWLRYWGLHLEIAAAFLAGAAVAFTVDPQPHTALLALALWLLGAYHSGRAVTTPLTRQFRSLAGSVTLPAA